MPSTGFGITITGASGFVAGIRDTTPPEWAREAINVPTTTSPDGAIPKIPADLADYGNLEVEIEFAESEVPPIDQPPETWVITFKSGRTWTFTGFLTNYAPAAPIDDVMTANVTIAVSGKITIA